MPVAMKRTGTTSAGISQLPVEEIEPNPTQPRRYFDADALQELSSSIAEFGVLNPLTVRRRADRYELVAGERRLRAAKLAGLTSVPCLIVDVDMEESGLLAMVENIQREDLDFVEEAKGMANLMRLFGMSQEDLARRLGRSQSAVANKLRLLKLPRDVLAALRENGLTERHGRALLRLESPEDQREALLYIVDHGLNVARTDAYIQRLLDEKEQEREQSRQKRSFILKDVRVFLNTLNRSLDIMKQGGIDAGVERRETDEELIVTISIPKK